MKPLFILILALIALPAFAQLTTRWTEQATAAEPPHDAYPRPTMVRDRWINLNGQWDLIIGSETDQQVSYFGKIRVPFPVESALSGVAQPVQPDDEMYYSRWIEIPEDWNQRILLHFDAVDHAFTVLVDANEIGEHRGGYTRATFDITAAVRPGHRHKLSIIAWDPSDAGSQARGKQSLNPQGIWYTPIGGIWQTVWLEPVPHAYIAALTLQADMHGALLAGAHVPGARDGDALRFIVKDRGNEVARATTRFETDLHMGFPLAPARDIQVFNPRLWSPEDPHLYDIEAVLLRDDKTIDQVESYAGFRTISLIDGEQGKTIALNGNPIFQIGPLDQGYWPDGLYTAPTDEALRSDVQTIKDLGFNMVRKHVKIEPDRWYAECDRRGLLVWQDMPSASPNAPNVPADDPRAEVDRPLEAKRQFERELIEMITQLQNHPSIVMWIPYNEGWGQTDTARIADMIKRRDPTRLVNAASGWNDLRIGDINDIHAYPGPAAPEPEANRAMVLGEFGGLGLPVEDHLWDPSMNNWGYRTYDSQQQLAGEYDKLNQQLRFLRARGLAAAVYTQLTDVEGEVNGLLTYDREVTKIPADRLREIHASVIAPAPTLKTILPDARDGPQTWRYTHQDPSPEDPNPADQNPETADRASPVEDWTHPDYDDSSWSVGEAGFGREGTPGAIVRTPWHTDRIWLRRTFTLDQIPDHLALWIHHDENAQVYLNGHKIADLPTYTTQYTPIPLTPQARSALRQGQNTLAITCRQTRGGQYIDAGLVEVADPAP